MFTGPASDERTRSTRVAQCDTLLTPDVILIRRRALQRA